MNIRKQYRAALRIAVSIAVLLCSVPLLSKDRRPSYPYITGDGFRAFADYIYDEEICTIDITKMKDGDVIFLQPWMLEDFFREYHPKIECKYIAYF